MKEFITIPDKNIFLLATELLGLSEGQLWIGHADGPLDNDDARVLKERKEYEQHKHGPGVRPFGIEAVDVTESLLYPGWFEVNTLHWPSGTYRLGLHGKANVQAPHGTPLRPIRDGQYSWAEFNDEYLMSLPEEQQKFLYLEKNQAGFCIRIQILPDGTIQAAGDGVEWIKNWPTIKKQIEFHYQQKINNT
jgi:hypothetical protein